MPVVYVVQSVLHSGLVDALIDECDRFRDRFASRSPSEHGAAIDLFEDVSLPEDHPARSNKTAYFDLRFRDDSSGCKNQQLIKEVISKALPCLLDRLPLSLLGDARDSVLYLFNEHYVVKEPMSRLAFRWHTDAQEQLGAVVGASNAESILQEYFSVWCPLDDVCPSNGTIYFPKDVTITYIDAWGPTESTSASTCMDFDTESEPITFKKPRHSYQSNKNDPESDEEGIPVTVPRGAAVIFGSNVWHRSSRNDSAQVRRIFYAQYSRQPVTTPTLTSNCATQQLPIAFAVPMK